MELAHTEHSSRGEEKIVFYLCETNELDPYEKQTELGIVILSQGKQIDFGMSLSETDQLIGFLKATRKHIIQRDKIKQNEDYVMRPETNVPPENDGELKKIINLIDNLDALFRKYGILINTDEGILKRFRDISANTKKKIDTKDFVRMSEYVNALHELYKKKNNP